MGLSLAVDDVLELPCRDDRCPECGHVVVNDEPAHYADCRFVVLEDEIGEDDEDFRKMYWTRSA